MAIDMRRPLIAAIQAALDEVQAEPEKKKRHGVGTGRALLLGAGLYTAGRVVTHGRGSGMLDAIQQRLPLRDNDDVGDIDDDDFDEELDEDEPQGEADEEEPGADAGEEEPDGEVDEDEPEADAGEEEPQGEADEDEPQPDEENPDDEAPAPRRTRGRGKAQSRR